MECEEFEVALLDEGRAATTLQVNHPCPTCRKRIWILEGECVANPLEVLGPELSYTYWGGWALLFEKSLQNMKPASELEGLIEAEVEDFVGNITEEQYPAQVMNPPACVRSKCRLIEC